MLDRLNYAGKLLCHSIALKLPEEIIYLTNEVCFEVSGHHLFQKSFVKQPEEFFLKRLVDVSCVCAVFSLLSASFLQLGYHLGTLGVCIGGLIQQKSIRDLTAVVSDLKEANIELQSIKDGLTQTNKCLRKTQQDLENTNQGLKQSKEDLSSEINRLKNIILQMEKTSNSLEDLKEKLHISTQQQLEIEQKIKEKLELLEAISKHINEQCLKLNQDRQQLTSDIKELLALIRAHLNK